MANIIRPSVTALATIFEPTMSITAEQLQTILQQQQKQFEEAQTKLVETLMKTMSLKNFSTSSGLPSSSEAVLSAVTEFQFDIEAGHTFNVWFKKYEDIFRVEFNDFDDQWKVRHLLRKLGNVEHERFTNFILPKRPADLTFDQAVQLLNEVFGDKTSLFNVRYQCLKMVKNETEDYVTYAGAVNKECERFQLKSMTEDQFKCLIFVAGLQGPLEADIRTRLLSKIDHEPNITLQQCTTECQRLVNLKHDSSMIERQAKSSPYSTVHAVDCRNVEQPK